MARVNNTITVTREARPCLVTILHRNAPIEDRKALFYGVFPWAEVAATGPLKEGLPDGQIADVKAMVEFEDGSLHSVRVDRVRLLDSPGKFKEYAWGDEEQEEKAPEDRTCHNCKHRDLDPEDDPCQSCAGRVHGYKNWEAKK